jgi:hypothetical protein
LVHSCLYILHYLSTCLLRTFSPQLFKKSRHTRKKSFFTEKKKKIQRAECASLNVERRREVVLYARFPCQCAVNLKSEKLCFSG